MTTLTASPPKPPEPETTVGPWDIVGWRITTYGPPQDPRREMGVSVVVVHREDGARLWQAVRILLHERSEDDAEVARRIAQAKDLLRAWVADLNDAEREDQTA